MIYKAKIAGADAVKIQAYEANGITMDSNKRYFKLGATSKWKKYDNLFKLYKKGQTPKKWYRKIFSYAKRINITLFASIFDINTLKFFENEINCPIYKIASPEIVDIPLLKSIAKTKKPIILSNGLSNFNDLSLAIKTIRKFNKNIVVLKCTSTYPASNHALNLSTMMDIKKKFSCNVGFSDHTTGIDSAIYSAALGANVLEKHVVLKKNSKTVDSFFSIDFKEFKRMVDIIRSNEKSLGKISYKIHKSSKVNLHGRKSIFVCKDIKKGEKFTLENIRVIRPYHGLHPKYFEFVLNKKCKTNLFSGDPLKLQHVQR